MNTLDVATEKYHKVASNSKEAAMDMPLPEAIKKRTVYRNAITGRFCTKAYAEAHPATTVKETL